ncbi:hypothetical protein [Arthrobacter sp. 31Y]|nr:hypothetical protein [Arthrobacter sp. 31Y]
MNSLAFRIAIAHVNATTMLVASVLPAVLTETACQLPRNSNTPDMP